MAAEVSAAGVNGTYAPHQSYGGVESQPQNNGADTQNGTASSIPAAQPAGQPEVSKDEVGWYFVEQYYTTLSRNPSKLYLFYNKRSQFVSGQETDKVDVCVGQRAIADRITDLDFQDCKVRVTNVDSQASDSNIVIQVIGEISNKQQPHKKFTQTFVLATQTNGYFVLNDIFRYLILEEDEPEPEAAATPQAKDVQQVPAAESEPEPVVAEEPEPKTLTSSIDPIAIERDATVVDSRLEEKVLKEQPKTEEAAPAVNGVANEEEEVEEEEKPEEPAAPTEEPAAVEKADVATSELPEKPTEPEPTPASSPPPSQAAVPPPAPAKPAAPKSWASLAASAHKVATPAAPSAPSSAASQQQRPTPPKSAAATAPAATPAPSAPSAASAPTAQRDGSPVSNSQDVWISVGGGHNRQQSRQTNVAPPQEGPQTRGYIKNVREEVDADKLRAHLETFGEVTHFDVARAKTCAFVDFKTPEAYQASVAANPHVLEGEKFWVEERRPRPGNTFVPRGQFQGGRGGSGRGSSQGGSQRGNFNGGTPRGNFTPRGGARGGTTGGASRGGRGGVQNAS